MEILREGKSEEELAGTATYECNRCSCLFRYTKNDITISLVGIASIKCPHCGMAYNVPPQMIPYNK